MSALLVSVLLHLLLAILLQWAVGPVHPPGSGALVATLRGAAVGSQQVVSPADASPDAAMHAGAAGESGPSESLQAALGEHRLAAYVPPYLATDLNVPSTAWYFPPAELTRPPVLLEEPQLPLQDKAGGAASRGGKAVLRVFIAADGTVDRSEVASSNLSPADNDVLLNDVARLRFRPGEIEGVAVSSETRLAVELDASDTGSSHVIDRRRVR